MQNLYKNRSGLTGATSLILSLFIFTTLYHYKIVAFKSFYMYIIFIITLISMAIHQIKINNFKANKINKVEYSAVHYRYITSVTVMFLLYCILLCSPFEDNFIKYIRLDFIRDFYKYIIYTYLIFAPFYIHYTLKYNNSLGDNLSDYALIVIVLVRSLFTNRNTLYKNRRVKKVFLIFIVNSFFITLMISFFANEFVQFYKYFGKVFISNSHIKWIDNYRDIYQFLVAILFFIDVGIALVGYISASRWLGNRVLSVDFTFFGWFVALACYPPFNHYLSDWLLSYNIYETHLIIHNDYINAFILSLMLFLYLIYVSATIEMGLKFGNLSYKGLVSTGVYSISRHPAYISKNITWIIDNTYVWTNFYALLAFLSWNLFYYFRAITEERHLSGFKEYRDYKRDINFFPARGQIKCHE